MYCVPTKSDLQLVRTGEQLRCTSKAAKKEKKSRATRVTVTTAAVNSDFRRSRDSSRLTAFIREGEDFMAAVPGPELVWSVFFRSANFRDTIRQLALIGNYVYP